MRAQVRSLGRGGGWGPLRRAPIQHLHMKGRPGLLRTVLEQQETRGLTRADDLSRLLPSEVRYINPVLRQILAFPTMMTRGLTTSTTLLPAALRGRTRALRLLTALGPQLDPVATAAQGECYSLLQDVASLAP